MKHVNASMDNCDCVGVSVPHTVGTRTTSTTRPRLRFCRPYCSPPSTAHDDTLDVCDSDLMVDSTWRASSLVGTNMRARGRCGWRSYPDCSCAASDCSTGRVKASVLPEPVEPAMIMFSPCRARGMTARCTGEGECRGGTCVEPKASIRALLKPMLSKVPTPIDEVKCAVCSLEKERGALLQPRRGLARCKEGIASWSRKGCHSSLIVAILCLASIKCYIFELSVYIKAMKTIWVFGD